MNPEHGSQRRHQILGRQLKALAVASLVLAVAACDMNRGAEPEDSPDGTVAGSVTVYRRSGFDDGLRGWNASGGAETDETDDAVSGKALRVQCNARWSGVESPIHVSGSAGLKLALHMKGRKLPSVGINVFDQVAGDNTTAYGYRYVSDDQWTPILYYLDRFHYNSRGDGFVNAQTQYAGIRFFGSAEPAAGTGFTIDNLVLYRGDDVTPPAQVTGLKAVATPRGVRLTWEPARDNVAAMVYVVARAEADGPFEKIAESYATSFVDAQAGKANYRYRVFAVDFEENFGPWSAAVAVASDSTPVASTASVEEQDRARYANHVRQVHASGRDKVHRGHATLYGDSLTGATLYTFSCQSALRTMTVDAFGFAGQQTGFARQQVGEILEKQKPELILVLFGTNNPKDARLLSAAMSDLEAVVKACEQRGSVVALGTIPPRGFTDRRSAPEERFNRQLSELCRKLEIPKSYIFESMQTAGPRQNFISPDGIHWTAAGMEQAGRAWGRVAEQVRFALRDQP